jgi:hypothetical protein
MSGVANPLTRSMPVWLLAAGMVLGQNYNGRISGTVSDKSGAVIPGATVILTNDETQVSRKLTTDGNGYYSVPNLAPGIFSVEADATGFRKVKQTGYDLADNGRITADFKLEVGGVTETVVVQEVLGETVNTVSGELGHTIDSEQVRDLALNGRNYMQLVSLIPGVALLDEDSMATTTSLSVTSQSVNGTRTNTSNLMVDGGMNLDSGSNGSQINNVGVGFIRELSIQTSAMSAEWGRSSGAVINAVTKGGGNRYHGELLYTIRNDALDAKDYFAPDKPTLRYHDYAWNLGGPVKFGRFKNRLFFFGGQEWKKINRFTSPTRRTLPTIAETNGEFADRTNTIRYPGTTTPIPNKDLRPLMTPDGKAVMKVYREMIQQAASFTDKPISNNAIYQVLNPFHWRQDILRVDYTVNDRNSVYFRWLHDSYDLVDPFGTFNASQLPTTPTARDRPSYGPQLADMWTISPSVMNEIKLNISWNSQRTPLMGDAWKRSTYGFQFPLLYGGNGPYAGIPDVTVNSFASYNGPARVFLISPTTDISLSDNVTYIRGARQFKLGVMIIRNRKDQNGRSVYDGSVAFNTSPNNNTTNYALADAALGNFSTYSEAQSDPVGMFRFSQQEAYIQNDWKVSRRLTLNLGFRYSHFTPTYTTANNIVNFDPALYDPKKAVSLVASTGAIVPNSGSLVNGLVRAGDGVPKDQQGRVAGAMSPDVLAVPAGAPRGFYNGYNLFMPRVGFAWAPFGNGRTVFRGGFGTFHDRVQGNLIYSQTNIPPFSQSIALESGNLGNPGGGTTSAAAVLGSINAIDKNLKVPAVYTYNLNVEKQLPAGLFVRLAYSGNLQRHLLRQPDINFPSFSVLATNYVLSPRPNTNALRPYKGFSNIRMYLSDANGNYNALQTYLTKRKGGSMFTVSYTWSHALADTSADGDNPDGGLGYSAINRHYYYGPTSFDRRQIFVVTYTYRIPFLSRRHGLVGTFGRWEVSGVTRAQSGPALTPQGSATGVTRRADYVGGEISLPTGERGPDHWFNTAAFKTPSNITLGTAGPGVVVGPGLYLWDVTLRKVFNLHEGWTMRFEAQAFNLMNHANFRSLSVTSSSADYGSVTGSGPARNIQAGIKINF